MRKKAKSNSVTAAVQAAMNAGQALPQPPAHVRLRPEDRPYWEAVVLARARNEWTESDLVVGTQLARCMRDIEVESRLLAAEGSIVDGRVNARCAVVDRLIKREQAFMRTLRMGGRVAGDARDEAGRRRLEQQARAIHAELSDEDGLLA